VIRIVRVLFVHQGGIILSQIKGKKKKEKEREKKEEKKGKKRRKKEKKEKKEKRKKKEKKGKKREKRREKRIFWVITITHNRQNINIQYHFVVLITTHQCTRYRPFEW